jgi:hypothetical protein
MGDYSFRTGSGQLINFGFRISGGFQPLWDFGSDENKNAVCLMYSDNDTAGIANFARAVSEALQQEAPSVYLNFPNLADAWAARETSKQEFFQTCQFGLNFDQSTRLTFADTGCSLEENCPQTLQGVVVQLSSVVVSMPAHPVGSDMLG